MPHPCERLPTAEPVALSRAASVRRRRKFDWPALISWRSREFDLDGAVLPFIPGQRRTFCKGGRWLGISERRPANGAPSDIFSVVYEASLGQIASDFPSDDLEACAQQMKYEGHKIKRTSEHVSDRDPFVILSSSHTVLPYGTINAGVSRLSGSPRSFTYQRLRRNRLSTRKG